MQNKKHLILAVDDNPQNLQIIGQRLEQSGYDVAIATDGNQALNFVKTQKPSLILLDIMMPKIDGLETCEILKKDPKTKDIPVIFLTAKTEFDDITKGFEAGAVDYIIKPFNIMELNSRVKTHIELEESRENLKNYNQELKAVNEELKKANNKILKQNEQLKESMNKLEIAARTDSLTGLLNRNSMTSQVMAEARRYNRNKNEFCIAISDIDHFKEINDNFGHDCGDFVLKSLSELIISMLREQDYVARWGGEEFLFLFPDTKLSGAKVILSKLRKAIDEKIFLYNNKEIHITMTFGVSEYDIKGGLDPTIKYADIALYEGKNKGRNCVVVYNEQLQPQSK